MMLLWPSETKVASKELQLHMAQQTLSHRFLQVPEKTVRVVASGHIPQHSKQVSMRIGHFD
jgi:hypothetical protein